VANDRQKAILFAVLAAVCYGVSAPFSKFLLNGLSPVFLAALLYLGAGIGMGVVLLVGRIAHKESREARITKKEAPWVLAMVLLDIAAPILLLFGLNLTSPGNVSLLNNFEIVATTLIAMVIFKETIGRRMGIAIALITLSSFLLSIEDIGSLSFSPGSLLVILACVCWGLENNCTRKLSIKDPLEIVFIKGFGSGTGALIIAAFSGTIRLNLPSILLALLLGFFAYGLSITFYIRAQRNLGAARTSAYYAIAPFIGAGLSLIAFRQPLTAPFIAALVIMLLGAYFAAAEKHTHLHTHEALEHEHRHSHMDAHHSHAHSQPVREHSHSHTHEATEHTHPHTPDTHHRHSHD
jgi:drug/metabolite transporter (DMT)-like permease